MLPRVNYLIEEVSAKGRYEHMGDKYDPEPKSTAEMKTAHSAKQQSTDKTKEGNQMKSKESEKEKPSKASNNRTKRNKDRKREEKCWKPEESH